MSKIGDLVALTDPENDYQSIEFKKVDLALVEWIEKRYNMDVRNGEILFIRGKLYWTSKGCSRISENKKTKGIRFEYIDPNKFSMPMISQNPQRYIIIKCILEKQDGGLVEGTRILDLVKEKRLRYQKKCACGNDSKYFSKTDDPEIRKCPKCGKDHRGEEYWLLKDYIAFAETKAFMRAVKLAYSVSIEDDIPEDEKEQAIDISSVKRQEINFDQSSELKLPESSSINLKTSMITQNETENKPENLVILSKSNIKQLSQPAKPIDLKLIQKTETEALIHDLNKPKSMNELTPLKLINNEKKQKEKVRTYEIGSVQLPNYDYMAKELDYEFYICAGTCRNYLEQKMGKNSLESVWKSLFDEFEDSIKDKKYINLRICFFEIFKEKTSAVDQIKAFDIFQKEFTDAINNAIYFAYKNQGMEKLAFGEKLCNELNILPQFDQYFIDLLEINNIVEFSPLSIFKIKDYEVRK